MSRTGFEVKCGEGSMKDLTAPIFTYFYTPDLVVSHSLAKGEGCEGSFGNSLRREAGQYS